MDIRVQDYLDDKLQSTADLESLESLLHDVKKQQDLLKQQLQDARRDHDESRKTAHHRRDVVRRQVRDFQKEQQDMDNRLQIVTQSETSDEAVQTFESSMEQLRKLDMAAGYVELLTEVDMLRSNCVAHIGEDDDAALVPYQRLQSLIARLRALQEVAEGAAPHLLVHVDSVALSLRRTIQKAYSDNLRETLQKLHWPKFTGTVPFALQKEFGLNIGRLLDLQKQDLVNLAQDSNRDSQQEAAVLIAFEILVEELEHRFDYHFSGDKPTNRLDKPEFFLNHVVELIGTYSGFVDDNIQPILLRHLRGSELMWTPTYVDATSALITALLPMVKRKLYHVANQLDHQPSLLSHLVQEVIQFDNALQDSYDYTPNSPSEPWRGLSFFLLDSCGHFDEWLKAERDFALARYQAIIEAPDAGDLDYDSVGADATKPTQAAIRVNDLLETITERYRYLSSFGQKIRFLMDVQIQIFDQYFQRLRSGLDAYLTMTSSVGRTMHTMTREERIEVQGIKGLDRLCRIFGSAEFLERAMRDWSDDVFFLELWAELDGRARHRKQPSQSLGNWAEIQQKTSAALGSDEDEARLEGALFDETASSYRRTRVRSEGIINDTLKESMRQALKPYAAITTWASLSSSTAGTSPSAELDPARDMLNEHLGFLSKAVGKTPLRRMVRHLCHFIQSYVWDSILTRASFSTAGATQLTTDLRALCATVNRYIGSEQAQAGMRRLLDGVTLLSLPVKGEIPYAQPGLSGEDNEGGGEWEGWEEQEGAEGEGGRGLSIFQVERLVFMDNDSARHALEQLGLDSLNEADARTILGNRIELNS